MRKKSLTWIYETSFLPFCVWCLDYPVFKSLDCSFSWCWMLIIALSYVDSLVSNKQCGFSPSISLNINTDVFLLVDLFPSRNLISFRLFTYLLQISQQTLWFLGSRRQRESRIRSVDHMNLIFSGALAGSHLPLSGCTFNQACKNSVNRNFVVSITFSDIVCSLTCEGQ